MNERNIKSNIIIKKMVAILCVMFTIVGLFGYYNMKPLSSSAATSASYYCSFGGGTTGYTNKSVTSFSSSASWIKVSLSNYGEYLITVNPSYNISSTRSSRYGCVQFKKNGSLVHTVNIYQSNPYLRITTPSVTVPNTTNGVAYVHVESNIKFYYSIADQYGVFKPCSGTKGADLKSKQYYNQYNAFDIPVASKGVNTEEKITMTMIVRAANYSFSRSASVIQEKGVVEGQKYLYSGSYYGYDLMIAGEWAYNASPSIKTYKYTVLNFDMPGANFKLNDAQLRESALTNDVLIEMPPNSKVGKMLVMVKGTWTPYASFTLNSGNPGVVIEPYGYPAKFNCSYTAY